MPLRPAEGLGYRHKAEYADRRRQYADGRQGQPHSARRYAGKPYTRRVPARKGIWRQGMNNKRVQVIFAPFLYFKN